MPNHLTATNNMSTTILFAINQALNTRAFKSKGVSLSYFISALEKALRRSLQRTLQSLIREKIIEQSAFIQHQTYYLIKLNQSRRVEFHHLSFHGLNSLLINGDIIYINAEHKKYRIETPSALLNLLQESFTFHVSEQKLNRLCQELENSFLNDIICLAYHQKWSEDSAEITLFPAPAEQEKQIILLEQWGCLGHPWHPNYKTKLGLSSNEVISLSPEFNQKIPIKLCALRKDHLHIEYMQADIDYIQWWKSNLPDTYQKFQQALNQKGIAAAEYLPIPVHPWQFKKEIPVLFKDEIANKLIIPLDKPDFRASPAMSFRTVYPENKQCHSLIKMPVSIRLTSAQRTVTPRSAQMGPKISLLLKNLLNKDNTLSRYLRIIPEPIGGHFIMKNKKDNNDELSRHLSFIIRDKPNTLISDHEFAIPTGSLFAENAQAIPLITRLIPQKSNIQESVIGFFQQYANIALHGVLGMYLKYGIAFEAHQQNSFVIINKEKEIKSLLIRDFGDIRINKNNKDIQKQNIKPYNENMTLIADIDFIREKLIHNLYMCHLAEILLLLSRYYHINESLFWHSLAQATLTCFASYKNTLPAADWQREKHAITEKPWPLKSFLRMRLENTVSDIVIDIDNPLKPFIR